ncbi:MAG: methionine synthase [Candidatus Rokubacteria bacterium 13_1_40CM_69_27]|nr:MAG: methionine synthase [Candidatus Rokubacteria bacterium 13_1_40CM_69_27]OLC39700.1 MAG: methionine synthase [Candidatus Rokubacteria bacterium 13_1_40CM_4_69_5]
MNRLREALTRRILVLDGAMGTMLQARSLTAADFGGALYEGCNEHLNLTRPDVIRAIHAAYLEAGAEIVSTNTFGCAPYVLGEYGLAERAGEIARAGARLAREAAGDRFVVGALGPSTRSISVTRNVTVDEVCRAYALQARALIDGGVDALLLETQQDTLNVKAAAIGIRRAMREAGVELPLMVSATIEPMGTMLAGQGVEALYIALQHLDLFSIGLNCATGPEFMTDHLRTLAALSTRFVSVYPNAGLPDERGQYGETPESLAFKMRRFVDEGWVNIVGGCCGTTPDHIRVLAALVRGRPPRVPTAAEPLAVSGIEVLYPTEDNRPIFVGERTNVIGSRRFKELVVAEQFEEAAEIGRAQVRGGAQVLDVCLANPDRDEAADIDRFMAHIARKVKVPLMIDSTDPAVIELALRHCQGKSIVNSINLEDGEERFEKVCPLLKTYGAATIVGCIDEDKQQGMAVTRARKLAIAERSRGLLTEKYGIPAGDLIFDPLVFPVGTGDQNYLGSAVETIEGVRLIKQRFPEGKTILGISNVSFGLPPAGREVLNAVFLYHCTKAGLDYAIVNTERLERYPSIPEEERRLAEDLIFGRGEDPVAAFAAHFRGKTKAAPVKSSLSLDERLARYIVEGSRDGLIEDLDEKLKAASPLEIINGPLMRGMDEVGRLFNDNQLIVAEVLQSAEAMKAAVAHLEPFMAKTESATRGTFILATVKGDVHDIGKNLVEIILSNNGYRVTNLGIKVPPEVLIAACHEHKPDAIGLSGLLVKSAQQMVVTAQDFRAAGIDIPLFVGGAALTKKFTATRIAPEHAGVTIYAKDAMEGLELANRLFTATTRDALLERVRAEQAALAAGDGGQTRAPAAPAPGPVRSGLERVPVLPPPDLEPHVLREVPLTHIYPYLNLQMLYGKHLGLRGLVTRLLAEGDPKAREVHEVVEQLQREAVSHGLLGAQGIYRWFRARATGETVVLFDAAGAELARFIFPRQPAGERLCLADYVRDDTDDCVALFAVTCGAGVRERAQALKERGEYLKSHALQALAIECAEGFAEMLHSRLRTLWGFPDPPDLPISEKLKARYRGIRVSFGYPACPNLADQATLWRLLRPEQIGIMLTDGFMMDPEASVSALVLHHPAAKYFKAD